MTSHDWRAMQKARIDLRVEKILAHVQKLKRQIDAGQVAGEEGRIWLEQFCEGVGVQLCAGDFAIADSIGVDTDIRKLGLDLWAYADRFVGDLGPLDYVVTNSLELFPDTLRVLTEWGRMLKVGGVFAIVARATEMYEEIAGPLVNQRRMTCFTLTTLRCHLERAGFEVFRWGTVGKELRVAARKR